MVNVTCAGSDTAPTIESEQAIDEKFDGIRYVFFLLYQHVLAINYQSILYPCLFIIFLTSSSLTCSKFS